MYRSKVRNALATLTPLFILLHFIDVSVLKSAVPSLFLSLRIAALAAI